MSDLVAADRVADARARIYGYELDALLLVADAIGLTTVPTSVIREVVDRMLDRPLAPCPEPPQSLDAWRDSKHDDEGSAA